MVVKSNLNDYFIGNVFDDVTQNIFNETLRYTNYAPNQNPSTLISF